MRFGIKTRSFSKQVDQHRPFAVFWHRLFKFLARWLCLYPAIALAGYDLYYWLKYAEFLDLDTYKIVPARALGIVYNLSNWDGVNVIIYTVLQLPIFITIPLANIIFLFIVFQSVLAIYYFTFDFKLFIKNLQAKYFTR